MADKLVAVRLDRRGMLVTITGLKSRGPNRKALWTIEAHGMKPEEVHAAVEAEEVGRGAAFRK